MKIFFWILYILPKFVQNAIAYTIGILWFDVIRLRRNLVLENIKRCFPEWSDAQVKKVARASFVNQGQLIIDFANMMFMKPSEILKSCSLENKEIFEKALAEKKGVMLLGNHLSNGDYGIAALSQYGYPMYLVAKHFSSSSLDKLLYDTRYRFGTKSIEPRRSSFDILKALKAEAAVIFVLDQFMGPPLGVATTFFGHPTGTAMGLALFAERTQASVIPCYAYRKPDRSYCVRFEEPVPFVAAVTHEETLQKMTQAYNDRLEKIARQYPEQWLWLHRRWKVFR